MKQLAATAVNLLLQVDDQGHAEPCAELAIIVTEPEYHFEGEAMIREQELTTFRFIMHAASLETLIKNLSDTSASLKELATP